MRDLNEISDGQVHANLIEIHDVIQSVAILHEASDEQITAPTERNLLLVGCSASVCLYDCELQELVCDVKTNTSIDVICVSRAQRQQAGNSTICAICAGPRRIYALRCEPNAARAEITSERHTEDTITCALVQTCSNNRHWLITGSSEGSVRFYELDTREHNIMSCVLTLDCDARVNCLCALTNAHSMQASTTIHPLMTHLAYALDNGYIGAYEVLEAPKSARVLMRVDRVWRNRCKHGQTPCAMSAVQTSLSGDDKLVIGFKSGRLEARDALTGQLMSVLSRCFESLHSAAQEQRLVGLMQASCAYAPAALIACSTSGQLVAFKLGDRPAAVEAAAEQPTSQHAAVDAPVVRQTISNKRHFRDVPLTICKATQSELLLRQLAVAQTDCIKLQQQLNQSYERALACLHLDARISVSYEWILPQPEAVSFTRRLNNSNNLSH